MDSITFNQIEILKCKLGENHLDYYNILRYTINEIFDGEHQIEYSKLLNDLYGVFPLDLFEQLSEMQKTLIYFSNDKKVLNTDGEIELPPEHLANFEWRFSSQSRKKILELLDYSQNICCLGTPTIYMEYIKNFENCEKIFLLDLNTPILETIKNAYFDSKKIQCFTYNAINDLNINLLSKFDVVLINPPWYLDYYKIFIYRSIQLLKHNGGSIILPLFPLLSRHNAVVDLLELKNFIYSLGCRCIKSLGFVDFDMPLFEENIFETNNIPIPDVNWRKAELVELKFLDIRIPNNFKCEIFDYVEWNRCYDSEDGEYFVINQSYIKNLNSTTRFSKRKLSDLSRKKISSENEIFTWSEKNDVVIKEN